MKLFHALTRSVFCLLPICKHLRHFFLSRSNVRLLPVAPGLLPGVLPVKRNKTVDCLGIGKGLHRTIAECDLNVRRHEGRHRTLLKADLIKVAGISRGAFYKHYYLITDVLADDIQTITGDVRQAMGMDIGMNWEIILQTVYRHKKKILLLLKAGMGMEILNQINRSMDAISEEHKLRILAWNGIIFNAVLYWANRDFKDPLETLASQLTDLTLGLYNSEVAAGFNPGAIQ